MSTVVQGMVIVFLVLASLMLSYRIGRQIGYKRGWQVSERVMPVQLRKQALHTGKCPICDERN